MLSKKRHPIRISTYKVTKAGPMLLVLMSDFVERWIPMDDVAKMDQTMVDWFLYNNVYDEKEDKKSRKR
ncbi:MAG: hypothetical protein M5E90_08750 [Asgard group archaeon]|nr:hypothetical protein [Asgard group archaeon]